MGTVGGDAGVVRVGGALATELARRGAAALARRNAPGAGAGAGAIGAGAGAAGVDGRRLYCLVVLDGADGTDGHIATAKEAALLGRSLAPAAVAAVAPRSPALVIVGDPDDADAEHEPAPQAPPRPPPPLPQQRPPLPPPQQQQLQQQSPLSGRPQPQTSKPEPAQHAAAPAKAKRKAAVTPAATPESSEDTGDGTGSDDGSESGSDVVALRPSRSSPSAPPARPPPTQRSSALPSKPGGPCDHCGALDSPQWRRGPASKPMLCNACGTRYRRTNQLGPPHPSSAAPRPPPVRAAPKKSAGGAKKDGKRSVPDSPTSVLAQPPAKKGRAAAAR